jgi:hypothetical protein
LLMDTENVLEHGYKLLGDTPSKSCAKRRAG